ncbi:MAG: hypothetical protein ACI9Z7_001644 [Alteromonas macleodii]
MKATLKHISLVLTLLGGIVISSSMSGCKEEVGCTTRTSDNYNPDAVRDDGSCINSRDKFLGIYSILHIHWPDSFPDQLNQQTRFMTIAQDDLREQEDDVKILNFGTDSLTVRALISRQRLTIPRQDLSVRGIPMTFQGEGHIDDDGYLTILYSTRLTSNEQLVIEDAVIFGNRFD